MNLEIATYVGVGPIKFGMNKEQVRLAFGERPKEFLKAPTSVVPTDAFDDLGIHIYYKKERGCEAIEMFPPANPTFMGQRFNKRPVGEILNWMKKLDESVRLEDSGMTSFKLGIGIFAPGILKNVDAPVEGVIAFEKGYYDS